MKFSLRKKLQEGAFLIKNSDGDEIIVINYFGKNTELIKVSEVGIKGSHNIYNSMAAALASYTFGIEPEFIVKALKNFKGVEHRLEFVKEVNNIKFINDSKATNVDSVWYAINAIDTPIILLLGGRDKGNDYLKLFEIVKQKVKTIIAIGESYEKVYREFLPFTKVKIAQSMAEAIQQAYECAVKGDTILLSPACSSFDWFENYEHRGKVFKELVNKLC